jgi:hypothetical protein
MPDALLSRLRETALIVLRQHRIAEDELRFEENEPGDPPSCLIRGHRVYVHVDEASASFRVHAGRWSGRRSDHPTQGAFLSAFEDALHSALAG